MLAEYTLAIFAFFGGTFCGAFVVGLFAGANR